MPQIQEQYLCPVCGKKYSAAEADRAGSFCNEASCVDEMVLLEPAEPEEGTETADTGESGEPGEEQRRIKTSEIGLGILVCDVSGSMEDFAFPNRRVAKLKLVANSVARGIWDLVEQMPETTQANAYLSLIFFSKGSEIALDDSGKPFTRSIAEIGREFTSAPEFSEFIQKAMHRAQKHIPQNVVQDFVFGKDNTKHYTNITAGLELAHAVKQACIDGDLSAYGGPEGVRVIEDVCVNPAGESAAVPNIRCLIYSDGAHNYPKGSKISNPFAADETSVLLTSFIGDAENKGAEQLREISADCPKHGDKAFFLINDYEGYQKLRGLFRMSSGVSGFCPNCMPQDY